MNRQGSTPSVGARSLGLAFTASLLVVGVAAVVLSFQWSLRTRLFVQVVGIPMILLLLVQVVLEIRRPNVSGSQMMDSSIGGDLPPGLVARRGASFVGWLAIFLAATWLFGIVWGGIPALCLYMLIGLREKPIPIVLMAVGVWAATRALSELVSVRLPSGVVFRWLG